MRCSECQTDVPTGVQLSAYRFVCHSCHAELLAAWKAEQANRWGACPDYLPDPAELSERIAAKRRDIGEQPRDVPAPTMRGSVLYVPKRVAYRSARRGTEERAV